MTDDELIQQLTERVLADEPNDSPDPTAGAPATSGAVTAAQRALGHPFPPFLHRIYLEVANGGIGPAGGIFDLESLVEQNSISWPDDRPDDPAAGGVAPPPRGVLFLVDWGCANWSMIDCRTLDGQIWAWEEGNRWAHGWSLRQWLETWLHGGVLMPTLARDVRVVGYPGEWFYSAEWSRPRVGPSITPILAQDHPSGRDSGRFDSADEERSSRITHPKSR